MALAIVVVLALALTFTNGFHDSSNTVAALIATRAARPEQAVFLAGLCNLAGPLLAGHAVADTVGGLVRADPTATVAVVGAGLSAALAWNLLTWWRGLPSSSSHALVGGLAGAAVLDGGFGAVRWAGMHGWRPVGMAGALVALAVSPLVGFALGFGGARLGRRALRRASRALERPLARGEWATAGLLALSHGANDAQKMAGVVTVLLVARGHIDRFAVPLWVTLCASVALTVGTAVGGWRIVRTMGSGIYRLRPVDGFVVQAGSAAVILGAAAVGGPVSTTHVVASSVVGVGAGQRWRRVRWAVVREMGLGWLITMPASAAVAALLLPAWKAVA